MTYIETIDPGNSGGSVPVPERRLFKPVPITYPCTDCGKRFKQIEELRTHRLNQHPIKRPYLYLANIPQHLAKYRISSTLKPEDLHFVHTEGIRVNGAAVADDQAAARMICAAQTGRVELALANSGYSVEYFLDFEIVSDEVADQVEVAFLEGRDAGKADEHRLVGFIDRVQRIDPSALVYAGALDRYLVGIMAKDRVEGCQVPYEDYPDKLGEASDRLSHIRRPVSEAVISLIGLIFNDFQVSPSDSEVPFLAATKSALREGKLAKLSKDGVAAGGIPVDRITAAVMLFATNGDEYRHEKVPLLENLVLSTHLAELDRPKLHLLLMAYYGQSGNSMKLREHYTKVRHIRQVADSVRAIYEKYDHE
jgi:hypothetical protein